MTPTNKNANVSVYKYSAQKGPVVSASIHACNSLYHCCGVGGATHEEAETESEERESESEEEEEAVGSAVAVAVAVAAVAAVAAGSPEQVCVCGITSS